MVIVRQRRSRIRRSVLSLGCGGIVLRSSAIAEEQYRRGTKSE